jgi:hypothetical protein
MPTGYTAGVADGKITAFQTFALQCARAFGATILMRDDPMDAPIPESFEPSAFYAGELAKAQDELARLRSLTPDEAARARDDAHAEAVASWIRRVAERTETRNRYNAMLAEVVKWEPPTTEHVALKEFMLQQLHESIRFDCNDSWDAEPTKPSAHEWLADRIKRAEDNIERYTTEHANEVERTQGRNAWIKVLRDSLTGELTNG